MSCGMAERSDEILCEVCGTRLATHTVPRGPRNEGHLNVYDNCNPFVVKADRE